MSISPLAALSPATASTATNAYAKSTAQESNGPTLAEISKLAVLPSDTVTLSAQARSLMQDQGVSSAFALLGN